MTKIKAGRPLIDLIKLSHAADLPVMIVGRHGVGKSELIAQAAAELKIRYITRDLSLMEPPDLVGLPKLDGGVTIYCPPSFLPTEGRGLMVFEELNRCPQYMRAPCLMLLTSRTLNDYRLPEGWLPVAAVNPDEEGYEVDELDPALLSRFVRVSVIPDRQEWMKWARTAGIHPGVLDYVDSDETIFDAPQSNPRAWKYVSDILRAAERNHTPREALRTAILGSVGNERGAAFLRFSGGGARPLTADEILDDPQSRGQIVAWIASGRLDCVRKSLRALLTYLQRQGNYAAVRADGTSWSNLGAFLGALPGDLREEAKAFFQEHGYEVPSSKGRKRS